jgi:hypothetical protein
MNPPSLIQTRTYYNSLRNCCGKLRRPLGILLLLSAFAGTARAETIVSSLGNPQTQFIGFSQDAWAASSFQTDNESWSLSSISVAFAGNAFGSSTADLRLFSDVGGKPGVSLLDLGALTLTADNNVVLRTFSLNSSFILNPSTTYWVALGAVQNGIDVSVLFDNVPPFTFTGVPGASMTYSASSSTGGSPPVNWITPGPNVGLPFEVDGVVATPEPGQIILMSLGAIGLVLRRKLR